MNKWLVMLISILTCTLLATVFSSCEESENEDDDGEEEDDDDNDDDDPPLPTDDDDSHNDYPYIEYCMESVRFDEPGYIVGQEPPAPWEVTRQGTISNATVDNFISKDLDPALHIVGSSFQGESIKAMYPMENLYDEGIVIRFDFLIERPVDYFLTLEGFIWRSIEVFAQIRLWHNNSSDDLTVTVKTLGGDWQIRCENISFDEWHNIKMVFTDNPDRLKLSIDGNICGESYFTYLDFVNGLSLVEDSWATGYGGVGWFDNLCIYGNIAGEEN